MDKKENKNNEKMDLSYLSFIGVPFLLVVAPICGYLIGDLLDEYLNTQPYLSYIFLFLGIVAGVREFYKLVQKFQNDKQDH